MVKVFASNPKVKGSNLADGVVYGQQLYDDLNILLPNSYNRCLGWLCGLLTYLN
jgi:hypothetical protein